MKSSRNETVKNSVGRALFVALSVLLQVAWIVGLVLLLNDYYYAISLITSVLAFLVVLNLYGKQMTGPTPGFCHAKMMLCDGETAAVGTINLDYRSLYLHFENGVFLYDCKAVEDVGKDFVETFAQCREVTKDYRGRKLGLGRTLLRLFAPLM